MSGDATFSGTAYQAGVIALVYVHVLMEHRLGWFELFDDTPVAISGEVKGPGDDALVEFRAGTPTIEIQAKHGLSGISSFLQVMDRVRAFPGSATSVVLVVDRTSSQWLYTTVADDLDRLRSGRQEIFRAHTRNIIAELGTDALALLRRVHIKPADVDASHDPEAKLAVASLEQILVDKTQAAAAWRILRDDAAIICAKRLARTRSDLIGLLRAHSIQVRGPQPTERLNHDLDLSKAFLRRHKPQAALLVLSEIEKRLTAAKPDGKTLHRFFQHQAAAYMQLGRVEDALELARKALDHDPKGVHALMVAALAAMGLGKLEAAKQYAEEATASHPHEPLAWTTRAQVASAAELPILSPPAAVAASVEYRTGLIQVLLNETNVNEAFELTSQLLNEGVRTPDVLLFRAEALLTTDRGDVAVFVPSTADEIERLTTEAIDGEPSDDTLRRALLARAMARRALGRSTEAEEDIRRAQDVQPEDPHAISEAAQTCIVDGKFEAARRILASSVVERYPILLAFRATALANLGEKDAATKDLNEALRRVTDAHDPDAVRLAAADAALDLDDLELAERALGACPSNLFSRNRALKTLGNSRAEIAKTAHLGITRTRS